MVLQKQCFVNFVVIININPIIFYADVKIETLIIVMILLTKWNFQKKLSQLLKNTLVH